ncbi:hypothetical protein BKA70DRAFT_1555019 [Coprinopsis sp. MPI-PUGE-AT-0042]|nr:hypothetical protein BKA70DRAFT_1555019 [Coprinopsis sp. MPI-PUGE-AT-0042]
MGTFLSTQTRLAYAQIGSWTDTTPVIIPSLRTLDAGIGRPFPLAFVNGSVRHLNCVLMVEPPEMTQAFRAGLRGVVTLEISIFSGRAPMLSRILDRMVPYLDNLRFLETSYMNLNHKTVSKSLLRHIASLKKLEVLCFDQTDSDKPVTKDLVDILFESNKSLRRIEVKLERRLGSWNHHGPFTHECWVRGATTPTLIKNKTTAEQFD